MPIATPFQWMLGSILILSSMGILLVRNPVRASLCFLLTLICVAALYLELSAQFIAAMQILVYAGAILVIFMFVLVLFQDAHQQIDHYPPGSKPLILLAAGALFVGALLFFGMQLSRLPFDQEMVGPQYGTAQSLGRLLYIDFFFPFEAVVMIFLVAVIGALYIGRKEV
ncbi:MAG: NADH-quinone oxidoreductase subunit J [Candidatus Protochlamydia sp.]|nr:NADH-quinone oxidoreductase subunit J [Candidatus Protochlamydia sp.]